MSACSRRCEKLPLYFFLPFRSPVIVLVIQLVILIIQLIVLVVSVSARKKAPIVLSHKVTYRAAQGDKPAYTTPTLPYFLHVRNAGRVRSIYGELVS